MRDALAGQVTALIAAQARRPQAEVTPDVALDALGLDSLNRVELVFAIEEAFDISLPFTTEPRAGAADLSTVGGVIAAVRDLVAAQVQ